MNTLLVIGNGFDRTFDAPTSYSEFFNSPSFKNQRTLCEKWTNAVMTLNYKVLNLWNEDLPISPWDLLFYLDSVDQKTLNVNISLAKLNWCDVEKSIHDSFIHNSKKTFSWQRIFLLLEEYRTDQESFINGLSNRVLKTKVISLYFLKKQLSSLWNQEEFYRMLLDELILFEKSFGKYIHKVTSNGSFKGQANQFINGLSDNNSIKYIDSFNYSDFHDIHSRTPRIIRHINGDYNNPIFGIDLNRIEIKNQVEQIRYFTKTSRRMYQDSYGLRKNDASYPFEFDKAIIYGHSLNEMDYDYFVYLFTILNINTFDPNQMGCIDFCYRIYNEDKAAEIRDKYTEAVYKLLNYYEEYVRSEKQQVLINLMIFSGKLRIRELDYVEIMKKS